MSMALNGGIDRAQWITSQRGRNGRFDGFTVTWGDTIAR